jgi:hypothetical protein
MDTAVEENQLAAIRWHNLMQSTIDDFSSVGNAGFDSARDLYFEQSKKYRLASTYGSSVSIARGFSKRARQRLINARLGLRVDRYYREQGKLPKTLEELVDEAMPVIPPGLYSGGAPRYEKLADGFCIHDGPLAEQVADDRFEVKYGVKEGAETVEE